MAIVCATSCLLAIVFAVLIPGVQAARDLATVDWFGDAMKNVEKNEANMKIEGKAKNAILFIGDGMGVSTVTASRTFKAQKENINLHESRLSWESFPYSSMSMPYLLDLLTPDSSATATAFLAGVKVNALTLGVDYRVKYNKCDTMTEDSKLKSILTMAHEQGKWTGIVTTTRITHATPAAAFAHTPSRSWEADYRIPEDQRHCDDIAKQLIMDHHYIRVLLGGGRKMFHGRQQMDPVLNITGKRLDGRNLFELWSMKQKNKSGLRKNGVKKIFNRDELLAIDGKKTDYLLGLFTPDDMNYELDRPEDEPTLQEMTEKAIEILSQNEKGFFLFVEGGRIDHAHHYNQAHKALVDTLMFSDAVQKGVDMTDIKDTLIVVSADHSHAFSISGYSTPDTDILGFATSPTSGHFDINAAEDGLPYLTLSYTTGPGFYEHRSSNKTIEGSIVGRKNLTLDVANNRNRDKEFQQDSTIPMVIGNHGGEDVTVHAQGPMAHLFSGTHEQNYIAHVIMYATCMQPYARKCELRSLEEIERRSNMGDGLESGDEQIQKNDNNGKEPLVLSLLLKITSLAFVFTLTFDPFMSVYFI